MPITNELQNLNKPEAAGFSHEQAKALVEIQEDGIQRGFDRFVQVLEQQIGAFRSEMREMESRLRSDMREMGSGLGSEIQSLRTEIQSVRADLMKEQHPSMPISNNRQSRVTFGGRPSE